MNIVKKVKFQSFSTHLTLWRKKKLFTLCHRTKDLSGQVQLRRRLHIFAFSNRNLSPSSTMRIYKDIITGKRNISSFYNVSNILFYLFVRWKTVKLATKKKVFFLLTQNFSYDLWSAMIKEHWKFANVTWWTICNNFGLLPSEMQHKLIPGKTWNLRLQGAICARKSLVHKSAVFF